MASRREAAGAAGTARRADNQDGEGRTIRTDITKAQAPQSVLDAALSYAARGWHVFPVPPGKKKSFKSAEFSNGRKWGATADAAQIRKDWRRWPDANVGIPCGSDNGFLLSNSTPRRATALMDLRR